MRDLSLHMLDIIGNSLEARASKIDVELTADLQADLLSLTIRDNGKGMDASVVNRVTDPFYTTRTTRSVGLGIPLLKELCELTGGSLAINSQAGQGTELQAVLGLSNIDRLPLGSISETFTALVLTDPSIDYTLIMRSPGKSFELDFAEVRNQLADVALNEPIVIDWLSQIIDEQENFIFGGVLHEIIS